MHFLEQLEEEFEALRTSEDAPFSERERRSLARLHRKIERFLCIKEEKRKKEEKKREREKKEAAQESKKKLCPFFGNFGLCKRLK